MHADFRGLLGTLLEHANAQMARSRWIATLVCTILALAGCGGSTSTDATPKNAMDTSTLTGKWVGSVNGDGSANSYGYSTVVTELRADSTLTLVAESQKYGTLNGVWTVSAGKWKSSGTDRDGVTVILTAPLSPTTLTGTWTASSGKAGIFTMSKLP